LTIRKLRKHGVDVVSATRPTGDDPSQILVRRIIGAFDEHASREISNTTRAMRESAKQGFRNGATAAVCTENSSSDVVVVKSAKDGV
jgi:site-specific DNA recombinase